MVDLDGPRIEPASRPPASLVVLLHGYGSSGDDLIGLAEIWRPDFPQTVFVAPHAPEPLDPAFGGYQWFPLTFRDQSEIWRGANEAGPLLDVFIEAELARYSLPEQCLAIVGFSQGTMMALHVGLRRKTPPAAIVGYSGMMAGSEWLDASDICRPPILLVHGEEDAVIPVEALHATRESLARAGVPVEWHVSAGLGHGIDKDGLALGAAFLRTTLAV